MFSCFSYVNHYKDDLFRSRKHQGLVNDVTQMVNDNAFHQVVSIYMTLRRWNFSYSLVNLCYLVQVHRLVVDCILI